MTHPGRSSSDPFLSSWWPSELNGQGKVRRKQCFQSKLWWTITSNHFSKEETERTRSKDGGPGWGYNYWRGMKCQYANPQFLVSMFSDAVFNSQRLKATVHMFSWERELPNSTHFFLGGSCSGRKMGVYHGQIGASCPLRTGYVHTNTKGSSPRRLSLL